MRKLALIFVALVCSVPAMSAEMLWRDIEAGEAEASVRARYPKSKAVYHGKRHIEIGKIPMPGDCEAKSRIEFEGGSVKSIALMGDTGECAEFVLTGLSEKYGKPSVVTSDSGASSIRDSDLVVWNVNGISVKFKVDVSRGEAFGIPFTTKKWTVDYRIAESVGNL